MTESTAEKHNTNHHMNIDEQDKENLSNNTESTPATAISIDDQYNLAKQSLKSEQWGTAVELLSKLCASIESKYGESSTQLADVFYDYGRSLLELYKTQSSVLGNVTDANNTDNTTTESTNDNTATNATNTNNTINTTSDAMSDDDTEAGGDGDDGDLEISNEVLELSRIIYENKYNALISLNDSSKYIEEKETAQRLSDIKQSIGDLYLEQEQFEASYNEYKHCIELVAKYHTPWNRDIAILHSQMGMCALFMNDRAPSALLNYCRMADVFNHRIQHIVNDVLDARNDSNTKRFTLPKTYAEVQLQHAADEQSQSTSNSKTVVISSETQRALNILKSLNITDESITTEIADCVDILGEMDERICDIEKQIATSFDTHTTVQQTLAEIRPDTSIDNSISTATSNNDDVTYTAQVKRKAKSSTIELNNATTINSTSSDDAKRLKAENE